MASNVDPIFRRLNRSGLAVLGTAEGGRQAAGASEIHMVHLLTALLVASDGPVRSAILAALSEDEFFTTLASAANAPVPDRLAYEFVEIEALPPVSAHVRDALDNVERGADFSWQAVDEESLFVGALAVTDCTPVAALLVRGVGIDAGMITADGGGYVVGGSVDGAVVVGDNSAVSSGETTRSFSPSPPGPPTIPDEPV